MKWGRILALLLFAATSPVRASSDAPTLLEIAADILDDQKAIATSPVRMDRIDAGIWGFTGASMLILTPNYGDQRSIGERLAEGIKRDHVEYNRFFRRLAFVGDGRVLYGVSLAAYGVGVWRGEDRVQEVSAHWIEALTDATIWSNAIKLLAGRNRPEGHPPTSRFTGPWGYFKDQGKNSSFPSGHSTVAFASAAVFTREFDYNPWVGVPVYVTAGGVAFARVYSQRHWITDVIFGAALGHSIGFLVENRRHGVRQAARIEPWISPEETGLRLIYQW